MKKIRIGAVLLLFLLAGCHQAAFNGNRVANNDCFSLDYQILNGSDSHSFTLEEGDVLAVSVVSLSGRVSMTIEGENGSSIYRGTAMPTSAFQIVIPADGTYQLTVTGEQAEGKISVTVQEEKP